MRGGEIMIQRYIIPVSCSLFPIFRLHPTRIWIKIPATKCNRRLDEPGYEKYPGFFISNSCLRPLHTLRSDGQSTSDLSLALWPSVVQHREPIRYSHGHPARVTVRDVTGYLRGSWPSHSVLPR